MPAPPILLLALTYLGFVSLGLPDAVAGVVWPSAHRHFGVGFQASAGMLGAVIVPTLGGLILQTQGAAWLNGMIGGLVVVLWLAIMALFKARSA